MNREFSETFNKLDLVIKEINVSRENAVAFVESLGTVNPDPGTFKDLRTLFNDLKTAELKLAAVNGLLDHKLSEIYRESDAKFKADQRRLLDLQLEEAELRLKALKEPPLVLAPASTPASESLVKAESAPVAANGADDIEYLYYLIKDDCYVQVPECSTEHKFAYLAGESFSMADISQEKTTFGLLFIGDRIIMFSEIMVLFSRIQPDSSRGINGTPWSCSQMSLYKKRLTWESIGFGVLPGGLIKPSFKKFPVELCSHGPGCLPNPGEQNYGLYELGFKFVSLEMTPLSTASVIYYELVLSMDFSGFLKSNKYMHPHYVGLKQLPKEQWFKFLVIIDAEKFRRILDMQKA